LVQVEPIPSTVAVPAAIPATGDAED